MSKVFSIRLRRKWTASMAVVLAAACMGVWTLAWNPLASAAPATSSLGDAGAATAKLEELHQRVVARTQAEEDDSYENGGTSWGHAISPEQAASLAHQLARARGDTATQ